MSKSEIPTQGIELEVVNQMDFTQWIALKGRDVEIKEETPYEAWYAATQAQIDLTANGLWAVGKLLAFGERKFGEKYAQVIDSKRYEPKTLLNAAAVVNSTGAQHHPALTFSHHAVVSRLTPDQQKEMLDEAQEKMMSVSELADEVKKRYSKKKKEKKEKEPKSEKTESEELADKPKPSFKESLVWALAVLEALEEREKSVLAKNWNDETKAEWKPICNRFRQLQRRMEAKN